MSTAKPQAIAGVSAENESIVRIVYPSIAGTAIGQGLGNLMELIPIKVPLFHAKISYLLFGLPCGLAAVAGYFIEKILGVRYVLTNKSVQKWKALGNRKVSEVLLKDVAEVAIAQSSGQVFYRASDIHLQNAAGESIMVLPGVSHAEVFRQTILEASHAQSLTASALETIKARQTA